MTARNHRRLHPLAAGASILVAACSTYGGEKLGIDPVTQKPVAPTGIPYTLVRPEYSLTSVPPAAGETKPTYTVTVTYQPDPNQQYSLRARPGFLADPDFTLNFGTGGTLSSVKTTITEQFTPTIKALGAFAGNLAALGVYDEGAIKTELIKAVKDSGCNSTAPNQHLDADTLRMPDPPSTVAQELERRLTAFDKDETLLARFHYASQAEYECLKKIRDKEVAARADAPATKQAEDAWIATEAAYPPSDGEYLKLVRTMVKDKDSTRITEQQKTLASSASDSLAPSRKKLIDAAKAVVDARTEGPLLKALKAVVDMNAATWKARHLLYLEDEISSAELALLRRPDAPARQRRLVEQRIRGLRQVRAETIGGAELYARAEKLRAFLAEIPRKPSGRGTAPATEEYAAARAELDMAVERFDALRAKVIAAAKPADPKPAPPLKDVPLVTVRDTSIVEGQVTTTAGKRIPAPNFVLVLEPVQ
ncbi:MAG TPA: hypothetical protein VEA60_07150 [Allosphingosinicella sp.]|nr:hypothetical protein [Allosphingosinicella sp.]